MKDQSKVAVMKLEAARAHLQLKADHNDRDAIAILGQKRNYIAFEADQKRFDHVDFLNKIVETIVDSQSVEDVEVFFPNSRSEFISIVLGDYVIEFRSNKKMWYADVIDIRHSFRTVIKTDCSASESDPAKVAEAILEAIDAM